MLPGPTGLVQQTTFLGFTQTPDGDNLEFAFCTFTDGVDFSLSTGEERPSPPTAGLRSGEAIRVDGRWLLNELQLVGSELPFDTVNPCAAFAAAEGG
jgi:hypothetical protein